jgi:hypothetical protein
MIDTPRLQSTTTNQNPAVPLSHSITVPGDQSPSITDRSFQYSIPMDEDDIDSSTTDKDTAPTLRTFRGWKRDTAHLDKSRLTKGLLRSNVCFHFFLFSFN